MPSTVADRRRRTVLIVEDDADLRDNFRAILEDRGYAVATASNGREALEVLGHIERPRVILLDVMMPVMSGPEFLDAVKGDPRCRDIPVVIVSACADVVDDSAPVAGFLCKPVSVERLLSWVGRF